MNIIGFDVSKKELVGVRTDKSTLVREKIIISNESDSIKTFIEETKIKYPHLMIASEATADYHRSLAECCLKSGIPFRLINPILTKQFTRATIRKKKTDLTDAWIIAKLALQGEGSLLNIKSLDPLKSINRTAFKIQRLVTILSAINQRFQRVFPGDREILEELAKPLPLLSATVKKLRLRVDERADKTTKQLLISIPGIGPTIANTLITEVGDINRFPSGKSLVAYAGLDPKIKQSGVSLKHNTKITKRGSPYLRKAVYISAYIAKRHDPELKEYFDKKIKEGKRHKEAAVATARKILYRVYAVWKRGTPYIKYPQKILT